MTWAFSHPWWLLVLANSAIVFMVAFVVFRDVKLYRFSPIAARNEPDFQGR